MRIFFAAILVVGLARAAKAQGMCDAPISATLQKCGSGGRVARLSFKTTPRTSAVAACANLGAISTIPA